MARKIRHLAKSFDVARGHPADSRITQFYRRTEEIYANSCMLLRNVRNACTKKRIYGTEKCCPSK